MNYTFKGQVKISDVQAAFDSLLDRINTVITKYNTADNLTQNLDLTVGSPTLAAGGYTLSIGGIKQILAAYAGLLIGLRAFRIDNTHVAVTDAIYFTEDELPIRIPSQILEGDGYYIYFNPDDNSIGLVNDDEYPAGSVLILDLSATDGREYLNEFRDVQLEKVPGYKFRIQKKGFGENVQADDNTIHRFQGAGNYYIPKEGAGAADFYDGTNRINVLDSWSVEGDVYRKHLWAQPANFLFIPKGCNTPLQITRNKRIRRTQYTVDLDKNSD